MASNLRRCSLSSLEKFPIQVFKLRNVNIGDSVILNSGGPIGKVVQIVENDLVIRTTMFEYRIHQDCVKFANPRLNMEISDN